MVAYGLPTGSWELFFGTDIYAWAAGVGNLIVPGIVCGSIFPVVVSECNPSRSIIFMLHYSVIRTIGAGHRTKVAGGMELGPRVCARVLCVNFVSPLSNRLCFGCGGGVSRFF